MDEVERLRALAIEAARAQTVKDVGYEPNLWESRRVRRHQMLAENIARTACTPSPQIQPGWLLLFIRAIRKPR